MEGGVRMLQIHKDTLLLGTTTNSILTAKLAGSALRNPLSGVQVNKVPLTQVSTYKPTILTQGLAHGLNNVSLRLSYIPEIIKSKYLICLSGSL